MALVLVVLATVVVLGAVTVVVARVQSAKMRTDAAVDQARLDEVCKAGIDLGIEQIWHQYVIGQGNTTGNLASYIVFINDRLPNNEDLNRNGEQDSAEFDMNGDGDFDIANPILLVDNDDNRTLPSGGQIAQVSLARTDDVTGTTLTIQATGRIGQRTATATQTVRVSGELFDGFEYGIMANNINCILCHAEVQSLDLFRNADPSLYNSFDRIKVATLESLLIRTSENVNTHFAGTIYTRGQVYNQAGTPFTASTLGSSTFKSYHFNSSNGKLTQDSSGNLQIANLANAPTDSDGMLEQFANLYLDYPTEDNLMTDGTLPNDFPAPFPDDDGDRYVGDEEFERVINSTNGSITFELDPEEASGSVTAGVAYGVPVGSAYAGDAMPTSSNSALSTLSSDGAYEGNLILIGTDDDPIVIDKKVAVDGDLVIEGKVKGWGQIYVRGNVYVTGDVTYADAPGEFGIAEDGTPNGFALTAGGSIMMGDYVTIRGKKHTADNGKYPSGGFIDMRDDRDTNNITKSGVTQTVEMGYFDDGVIDAGWSQGAQDQLSFTTSELMLFNQMEYEKAQADSNYTARYYRLRPDQPLYRYVSNDEHTVKYGEAGVLTISDPGDAAIHDLNPNSFWLTEDQLRNFWYADEMTRPSSGRPFQFDGLLYSNNSIFAITRSSDRHKSNTRGQMTVRGSVVTADLGVLVPGPDFSVPRDALELYYDKRVADFMRVEDTTQVAFQRLAYRLD
jgi:hypothetical protein